jgi:hypothetical protein
VIDQPNPDSYSLAARICLGVAMFGLGLLVTIMLTSTFVIR